MIFYLRSPSEILNDNQRSSNSSHHSSQDMDDVRRNDFPDRQAQLRMPQIQHALRGPKHGGPMLGVFFPGCSSMPPGKSSSRSEPQ